MVRLVHEDVLPWGLIDAHEISAGRPLQRPRVKVVSLDEMRRIARGPQATGAYWRAAS
jgi:hypothetical protein